MVNIVTLGSDCSPAATLRNLGMRSQALPFDWVCSSVSAIKTCITEGFARYHTELVS